MNDIVAGITLEWIQHTMNMVDSYPDQIQENAFIIINDCELKSLESETKKMSIYLKGDIYRLIHQMNATLDVMKSGTDVKDHAKWCSSEYQKLNENRTLMDAESVALMSELESLMIELRLRC